jgi:hypothetical protein
MNPNHCGFTPKKTATDTALTIKEYIEEGMREGHIAILVSLDVKGAFDTAWWPSILNALKNVIVQKNYITWLKVTLVERQQF